MENAMNRTTAAYLVSAAVCAGLLVNIPSWAQAMDGRSGQYASDSYPYGYFCLTYPTYPTPTPPSVFSGDYGCPSRNIYHANLRTSRLFIPGAPDAYDAYYYDWTDPLDHVTSPFVVLTWPIKALSTPVVEVEPVPLAIGRSIATGQMGKLCATPVKICELSHASDVGNGCSCRVPGGRARGSVTP